MKTYYIGADVDSKMTNFAVEAAGRIVGEYCVPTTISGWRSVLSTLEGTRIVAMTGKKDRQKIWADTGHLARRVFH